MDDFQRAAEAWLAWYEKQFSAVQIAQRNFDNTVAEERFAWKFWTEARERVRLAAVELERAQTQAKGE